MAAVIGCCAGAPLSTESSSVLVKQSWGVEGLFRTFTALILTALRGQAGLAWMPHFSHRVREAMRLAQVGN